MTIKKMLSKFRTDNKAFAAMLIAGIMAIIVGVFIMTFYFVIIGEVNYPKNDLIQLPMQQHDKEDIGTIFEYIGVVSPSYLGIALIVGGFGVIINAFRATSYDY